MTSVSNIERLFRIVSEGVPDYSIVLLDPDGTIISWTPNAELIEGHSTNILGESIWCLWSTQEPPVPTDALRRAAEQRMDLQGWRERPDGNRYWAEETVAPTRNELGELTGFIRITRDATRRYRDEQEIRERERYFRRLIEHASDAITILNPDGTIRYSSPAIERHFGYSPQERQGRSAFELLHPDDERRLREAFGHVLRTPDVAVPALARIRTRSGEWREAELIARNLLDDPVVRGIVINTRDVTEQRILEEQLLQAQKMEAIGRLAGGIAHDFNNLLTAIRGHAELGLLQMPEDDPARMELEGITHAAERASSLTRQLLAFSRRQLIQPRVLEIDTVIVEMERLLRRLIGEDIELVTRPGATGYRIRADRAQIEQVLMNLAVNSRDAMPSGGRLVIATGHVTIHKRRSKRSSSIAPGEYVRISVTDTGTGMDNATLARVFEPFFTTKGLGAGTGLGLATVYGIVRQAGGHISVESEPGRGSTFDILLPEVAQSDEPGDRENDTAACNALGETVLLVEDEDAVRALTSRILRKYGYSVLEARDGTEAVQLSERFPDSVHLLLTDVVMPKMSGREVAERLTCERPNMRVLFMSGYTDDELLRHGVTDRKGPCFLEKPFTPEGLHRAVRECLDR